ncbi:MAG TPA: SDR family oxidoreductase [Streptosporangiales bacterium]
MTNRLLAGRVAIVLGGGGTEAAVARALAAAGAGVVVAGRDPDDGPAALVEEITATGGDALAVAADGSVPDSVRRLVEQTLGAYGRLDAAVNLVTRHDDAPTPLRAVAAGDYDAALRETLYAAFCAMRYEMPAMAAGGGGAVVNLTDADARRPTSGFTVRAAAAHGVVGLTRAAAAEYADAGVRANVLVAGGRPGDVAAIAVWLCSPLSAYVNGTVFPTHEREDISPCVSA